VVDDFAEVREMFAWLLRKAGCQVLMADSAKQAQHLIGDQGSIDLLVTDLNMPGMNGMELARWFRSRSPLSKMLLVSGSACEAEAYLETAPWLPFLDKADAFAQLVPMVEKLLAETTSRLEGFSRAEIGHRTSAETKVLREILERTNNSHS
jgi:DNA-binding NtrC family response regulator